MATGKLGALFADIRGPVGELTFSRGQTGQTIRQRTSGNQPHTPDQDDARAALGLCAIAWSSSLTERERQTWRSYANTNPRPGRWHRNAITSGYLAFIRHNVLYARVNLCLLRTNAPTAPPIHPPILAITVDRTLATADVTFPPAGYDDVDQNLTLYLFTGIPLRSGRTYYDGPWKLWYALPAPTTVTPDTLNFEWTHPHRTDTPDWAWPIDQDGTTRAYAIAQDDTTGAISSRATLTPTVIQS